MGRYIDHFVLTALCALGYYLFFLNAWGSIPLAGLAAFAACTLTRHLLQGLPRRRRASRAQARAALLILAAMDEGEAAPRLRDLVERRYPGEVFDLAPVLKHPEASLSCGDVMNAWKANRAAARLVITATCPCEPRAAQYARELRSPAVAMVDSRALLKLLRAQPIEAISPPPRPSLRTRLRRLSARIASVRVTPRDGLLGVALLCSYLLTGNPYSLFAALVVLAHIGIALIQRRIGQKLFEGAG